jgi:hypothetical protein
MFDGISPEVEALLNAAKSDLPVAKADAGLLNAMTLAMSADTASSPLPRRRPMLGKVLTAKAAAIAGVLVLTSGVAAAATGTLPGPVKDAAEHVGIHISDSGDEQGDNDDQGDDTQDDTTSTTVEHPDNHGNDVSTVAHDDSNEGADHGSAVCTVASEGKCQPNADDENGDHGKSGEHHEDGDHETTSTTVNDDGGDDGPDSHPSGGDHPDGESHPDDGGHHGSDDSGDGS